MKNKSYSIILLIFLSTSIFAGNKENDTYFTTPITGTDPNSKVLGPLVRIELQEDDDYHWVGVDIDTMIQSRIKSIYYLKDTLPEDIRNVLTTNKINYLILSFIYKTDMSIVPDHFTIKPNLSITPFSDLPITIERVPTTEKFDTTHLLVTLFDVKQNRIMKKQAEMLNEKMCKNDMVDCVKSDIINIAEDKIIYNTQEIKIIDSTNIKPAVHTIRTCQVLFWTGQIAAIAGLTFSGFTDNSKSDEANTSMQTISNTVVQAGLLTMGLSTIPMNHSVRLLYGKDIPGNKKFIWSMYAVSLFATTAGTIMTVNAEKKNNDALYIQGAIVLLSGNILEIVTGVCFFVEQRRASRLLKH